MKKLNIALVPADNFIKDIIINLAKIYFNQVDNYQLNHGKSHPHLSIIQIEADEQSYALVKDKVLFLMESNQNTFGITLQNKLFVKDNGWNELRPKENVRTNIQRPHDKLLKELKPLYIYVANASGESYVPHFTLAKSTSKTTSGVFDLDVGRISNEFNCNIAVGFSDDMWQFVEFIDPLR